MGGCVAHHDSIISQRIRLLSRSKSWLQIHGSRRDFRGNTHSLACFAPSIQHLADDCIVMFDNAAEHKVHIDKSADRIGSDR